MVFYLSVGNEQDLLLLMYVCGDHAMSSLVLSIVFEPSDFTSTAQYNRSGTAPKNLQLTMSMPGYLLMFQMSTSSFTISYLICYLSICRITSLDIFILYGFLTLCLHFMLILSCL